MCWSAVQVEKHSNMLVLFYMMLRLFHDCVPVFVCV